MEEIWKDIDGYDGLYQVSNLGNIRSLDVLVNCRGCGKRIRKGRVLKQKIDKYGYYCVCLCENNKRKYFTVHRLVAQAFLPNPDNLPQVNHKDENKLNNRVDNLEYCTNKYNTNYGTAIQRSAKRRINHPSSSKQVSQYTKDGNFVAEYPSSKEACRQTGINFTNINNCCKNRQYIKKGRCYTVKYAGGFIWRYKENGGN